MCENIGSQVMISLSVYEENFAISENIEETYFKICRKNNVFPLGCGSGIRDFTYSNIISF